MKSFSLKELSLFNFLLILALLVSFIFITPLKAQPIINSTQTDTLDAATDCRC
ncbi:MAG: hypothetical protein ACRENO_03895 [Thermodesulfobacteriota bacterium]